MKKFGPPVCVDPNLNEVPCTFPEDLPPSAAGDSAPAYVAVTSAATGHVSQARPVAGLAEAAPLCMNVLIQTRLWRMDSAPGSRRRRKHKRRPPTTLAAPAAAAFSRISRDRAISW
jgi:hypothetical protein